MKNNKLPFPQRLLLPVGLLMVTIPMLLKTFLIIPDFLRGALLGGGLVFEFTSLIFMKRKGYCNTVNTDNRESTKI